MSNLTPTDFEAITDFRSYAAGNWTILDKWGVERQFDLNPAQERVVALMQSQRAKKKPVRVRVLKFRQCGNSTLASALMLHMPMTMPGCTTISLADKAELPAQWIRRAHKWYEQTPECVKPHVKASNAYEMYFDGFQSRYYIGSAEGTTPGMGATIQGVHCSEIASWVDPDFVLSDLLPAVPPGRDTVVIQESTGRSVGDWWYLRYHESKRGEDEFSCIFLPWFIQPEYSDALGMDDVTDLTDYEKSLVKSAVDFGIEVNKAQLAWRRATIRTVFHGNETLFSNQYPANEDEAFLAGGSQVFQPIAEQRERAMSTVRAPLWIGNILPGLNPQQYELQGNEHGHLLIWEEPDDRYHYVLGADCMWSLKDDGVDFDCGFVECLETAKVVAKIKGRFPQTLWGKLLASLGYHYNTCPIAPERNAVTANMLMPLLLGRVDSWQYPNVWIRIDDVSLKGFRPQDYGFLTTESTKGEILAFAMSQNLIGAFDWADEDTVKQMVAYIRDEHGKLTAPPGAHDDDLMGRMITAYVAHRLRGVTDLYHEPVKRTYKFPDAAERMADMLAEDDDDDTGNS